MVIGERPSLDKWLSIRYIPPNGNAWGGAGETLEVSIADFALSQLALRLDPARHREFLARGQHWKNVFNPASSSGFAEGSAAQYTWMVPHNVRGLFDRMGGNTAATNRLDTFFHTSTGGWALTNAGGLKSELDSKPSIWVPWLYNFSGRPYKTQETVRQVVDTLWSPTPGGIPRQDDLGAMSAWYVLAAMGMHPLTPGRAELLLASPLFSSIVVHRANGVNLTINAPGASAGTKYVRSLTVNGAPSTRPWLPESFVTNGGTLSYTLATTPNTSWGSAPADARHRLTAE